MFCWFFLTSGSGTVIHIYMYGNINLHLSLSLTISLYQIQSFSFYEGIFKVRQFKFALILKRLISDNDNFGNIIIMSIKNEKSIFCEVGWLLFLKAITNILSLTILTPHIWERAFIFSTKTFYLFYKKLWKKLWGKMTVQFW